MLEFPKLISPLAEEFQVGSMLTHINEACVCKSRNVPTLLAGSVVSIAFVNNLVAWQAVKNNPKYFDEQMSLAKNGFLAKGHTGRLAVLTVVSAEFCRINAVSVGDLLLSVGGVSTDLMSSSELEAALLSDFVHFEVRSKVASQCNNSPEQLSLSKNGFYATGHRGRAAVLTVVSPIVMQLVLEIYYCPWVECLLP